MLLTVILQFLQILHFKKYVIYASHFLPIILEMRVSLTNKRKAEQKLMQVAAANKKKESATGKKEKKF